MLTARMFHNKSLALLFLFVVDLSTAKQWTAQWCPKTVGTFREFTLTKETYVRLQRYGMDGLCTLVRKTDDQTAHIPMARTYGGREWERAGGAVASRLSPLVCNHKMCELELPIGHYVLQHRSTSTNVEGMTKDDAMARFYESASFGVTQNLLSSSDSPEQYITKQIALPATSHREFFRRTANPLWLFDTPEFGSRSDPCGSDSSFAENLFSVEDSTRHTNVIVTTVGAESYLQITVHNQVRAVLKQFRYYEVTWRGTAIVDFVAGTYSFCNKYSETFRKGVYMLSISGRCYRVHEDDVAISFEPGYEPPSHQILATTLPSTTTTTAWTRTSKERPEFQYTLEIDSSACNGLNIPERTTSQIEYYDGGIVFAKTEDGWLRHTPRIEMLHNTVEEPLPDGGLKAWRDEKVTYCSNVKRNLFNEKHCMLTWEEACIPGATSSATSSRGVLTCGSKGEIANDPTVGDSGLDVGAIGFNRKKSLMLPASFEKLEDFEGQRERVWAAIAISAEDQLRQRAAWALSQIFSLPSAAIQDSQRTTEIFLQYYDIFVRNAFGNYYDILREVSYNSLNAESLTYINGKSPHLVLLAHNETIFADENYSRELMQLFSIGLFELNMDGTLILDENSVPTPTYGAEHIMSFARIWLGMVKQQSRANNEVSTSSVQNKMDPLLIDFENRDFFPKIDLHGGYIGDGKPLCADIPPRAHLRKGAKYLLLGSKPKADYLRDPEDWEEKTDIKRLEILSGPLFDILCKTNSTKQCTFPAVAEISTNIGCNIDSQECAIDRPRLIYVQGMYYEYVQTPCVHQAFIPNARKLHSKYSGRQPMCASHKEAAAGVACCDEPDSRTAFSNCMFAGERTTFETAVLRCNSINKYVCDYRSFSDTTDCPDEKMLLSHRDEVYKWTSELCSTKAEINEDGRVKINHNTEGSVPHMLDGPHFFDVAWSEDSQYPKQANNCTSGACTSNGFTCLCDVVINESIVFSNLPSSWEEILNNLKIGFPDIDMFDSNDYIKGVADGFNFYQPYDEGTACCSENTVFKIKDQKRGTVFFKNIASIVTLKDSTAQFQNPPHFMSFARRDATVAEAQAEIEALLQHLFYHNNTAPFVAKNLIQRFGTSNPTPAYVMSVAKAFYNGEYTSNGVSFGSGKYGDMTATITAVQLHDEKMEAVLDVDPTSGSLREPILKVIAFMRALSFDSVTALPQLIDMNEKIGQMAYENPSVFSFFRSEYKPPQLAPTQLAGPESEVMTLTNVVGLLNGMIGLVDDGLAECPTGFDNYGLCGLYAPSGMLHYKPSSHTSTMIDDLSTFLTAGRLAESKRQLILSAVENITDSNEAFREAVKLVITAPEFHSTNRNANQPQQYHTVTSGSGIAPEAGYKAVIHISLDGGCDSANVLVPERSCALRNDYDVIRGEIRLTEEELINLGGSVSGQPCSNFSIHHKLSAIKKLWDDGDLLFTANTGVMTKPVTLSNYRDHTRTRLFAHNSMRDEVSSIDPENTVVGSGTLGRMAAVLESKGFRTGRVVVDSVPTNLATSSTTLPPLVSLGRQGLSPFDMTNESSLDVVQQLNADGTSGIFGNLWSESLGTSLAQTEELQQLLDKSPVSDNDFAQTDSKLGQRFKIIAQMISARNERGVNRDHFYVSHTDYDTHKEVKERQDGLFTELNQNLADLIDVLKDLGVWDGVIIVQTSDFGRTLSNSGDFGSDHGWGGHYWMAGGSVKGKQLIGEFPSSLKEGHELDVGRGRLLPTTPWDAIFNSVADWMGVRAANELDIVLPNRYQFPPDDLFLENDIFTPGSIVESIIDNTTPPNDAPSPEITTLLPTRASDEQVTAPPECTADNFKNECTTTPRCKQLYGNAATDCWNGGGGVCYIGVEIAGCVFNKIIQ